jgi:glutamate-5-semialdehyde dehydrogenase
MDQSISIESICRQARAAANRLAHVPTDQKNAALLAIADQLWAERQPILAANAADISAARTSGLSEAMLDRLLLDEKRLENIITDLKRVTELSDPVGEILEEKILRTQSM